MVRISVGLWKRRQTQEEELPTHDLSEPFFIPDIGSVRLFQFCLFDVPVLYLYQRDRLRAECYQYGFDVDI